MRCEEVQGLLDQHLEKALTEEMSGKIERHLLRCPGCAYEARTLEQTCSLLRESLEVAEASPGFRERTAARLQHALFPENPAESTGIGRQWKLPLLIDGSD